jgi:hypothetical protein
MTAATMTTGSHRSTAADRVRPPAGASASGGREVPWSGAADAGPRRPVDAALTRGYPADR